MKIIAGNWKMNGTPSENLVRLTKMKELIAAPQDQVIVIPPFVSLCAAQKILSDSPIYYGSQNVHHEVKGAYTGEISVPMLKDMGVTHCLVGHSERRLYFNECGAFLEKKLRALMEGNLIPIFCVGETLEQREGGFYDGVLERQLRESLADIPIITPENFVLAYEPVWAIGTGKTATAEDADKTMKMIRNILHGMGLPKSLPLLYGGSAKPENAKALLEKENIDGLLIGGAALDPESFSAMVNWRDL